MALKTIHYGHAGARFVLLQMVDEHDLSLMEEEVHAITELSGTEDFELVAFQTEDWQQELSPWCAPPAFGQEPFGAGAGNTLRFLTEEWLPANMPPAGEPRVILLGGYSLAGLFALWSSMQSDRFAGVASVSPSVWFPDFVPYAQAHLPKARAVYLSLGDREEQTRNSIMAKVGDAIRTIHADLVKADVPCTLEWNPGNHFKDSALRTAKGFAWLLRHLQAES